MSMVKRFCIRGVWVLTKIWTAESRTFYVWLSKTRKHTNNCI